MDLATFATGIVNFTKGIVKHTVITMCSVINTTFLNTPSRSGRAIQQAANVVMLAEGP